MVNLSLDAVPRERWLAMTPLRRRFIEDLQLKHFAPTTIDVYVHAVSKYARHYTQPNDDLEPVTDTKSCPACKTGVLTIIELPQPVRPPHFIPATTPQPIYNDSS